MATLDRLHSAKLDGVTIEQSSPRRLLQRTAEVMLHYGTFSFQVTPGAFDVPQELFAEPEPVAVPAPDGLYLCAGASFQVVLCDYEVWNGQPVELLSSIDSERVEIAVEFSMPRLHLWSLDELDPSIPLPHAGRYWADVRVTGREASRETYNSTLVRPVTGIESWLIRFWPASSDDANLEAVAD